MKQFFATAISGIGYIFLLLTWLWPLTFGLPLLIDSGVLTIVLPEQREPAVSEASNTVISPAVVILVAAVTVLMFIVTAIVLWRLPKVIGNSGDKIVQSSSQAVLPVLTHHKQLPAKKRRQLTQRLNLGIQLLITLIPLVITALMPAPEMVPKTALMTTAGFTTTVAAICFLAALGLRSSTSQTRSHASHE